MAKAQFHRNQKVWVESVGAWAAIDRIVPVWAQGFDEPVRITYDVGLGREFLADELQSEARSSSVVAEADWRVLRARNKWQALEDSSHHPWPGTFPVVVSDVNDWGGWRVPGAEYDRDPNRIEIQARLIAAAPKLMALARELCDLVAENPDNVGPEIIRLARTSSDLLRDVADQQPGPRSA